jgi:MFS family permease
MDEPQLIEGIRSSNDCLADVDGNSGTPYQRLLSFGSESTTLDLSSQEVLWNFVCTSILFSANHGAMVSCLAFATLQLGSTGAWELSLFHFIYAASALLGATYICKQLGSRNSMLLGMLLYASYVTLFWLAVLIDRHVVLLAIFGAVLGGVGGGLVWTAQGSYFSRSAESFACSCDNQPVHEVTSYLAGIFAFVYLLEEVMCKMMSWLLLQEAAATWSTVLAVYSLIAIVSTVLMLFVHDYPVLPAELEAGIWYKTNCAWQLLTQNPKMKYLIGLNAVFGFACPFVNAYVNGEVVQQVLPHDTNRRFVGLFSALSAAVAAICSLVFGRCTQNKGTVLIVGALSFMLVAVLFLARPDLSQWTWVMLMCVYCAQGVGRATFEGALRAVFADYFPGEKEGSYANIILQNGAFTSLGFLLSFALPCWSQSSVYCVESHKGGRHDVLVLELAIVATAAMSILGFLRAQHLHREELRGSEDVEASSSLVEDDNTETSLQS